VRPDETAVFAVAELALFELDVFPPPPPPQPAMATATTTGAINARADLFFHDVP
jgi:hypothetical protein